ncbi:MAG TPA: BNR-4 repeat-containing protein [Candidatus Hydrogenedentes bacterium]|nr:BNR-4 repeat-containing protein [Candidatus Hydrogenedentota bacterium]HPG69803.1 BNR-4 repeat-containing protein [Candidatus Hydrogenedentota bacterium]
MKRWVLVVGVGICLAMAHTEEMPGDAETVSTWSTGLRIGGAGGVYLLASPGDLWIDVEKCDLNRTSRATHLRAILVGPDREVLDEQWLSDDGRAKGSGPGPVQRVRLAASVPRTGIYALNLTVTEDRYGEDYAWGFATNCPRYLVETSRGHRDARHEEPLVLLHPDAAGDVCFLPPTGEVAIEATGLPAGGGPLALYDADGQEIGAISVSDQGEASGRLAADMPREAVPWRLHFPKFAGVIRIDGVTRWEAGAPFEDLSLWTPRLESWFAFHENRWLITPYSRTVYAEAGVEGSVAFRVHNNGPVEKEVALTLEFPGEPWPVELEVKQVTLAPGESESVRVRYRVSAEGDAWACHVRATPNDDSGVTTFSTLRLRRGTAPAAEPLVPPLVLEPYRHENELFGYLPQYPCSNQVYFDLKGAPVVCADTGVAVWRDGAWTEVTAATREGTAAGIRLRSSKAAFDSANDVYLIGEQSDASVLLHGPHGGDSLVAYPIPGKGPFDIEQFSGHNVPDGPPPFVRFTLTATDPKVFWRRVHDLHLFLPEKASDGAISMGEPILLSKQCIGFSAHSGIPSAIVSRGTNVHVIWGEATDPEEKIPGVPTFVATYDRGTGILSTPALIGYGPPANDVHNTPCITMDSQGYLHALVGTHGRTFQYARSLEPNNAAGGWTEAEDLGPDLRQTYVGLVCDRDDTLHVAFRLWREDKAYFPASHYACLAHMSKRPGAPWSEPRLIIVPPLSEYSVYYHRLTIDRAGRLFLSYDYWSTFWFYRMDHVGSRRALMMSPDQGVTWKLATLEDLIP